MITKHRDLNTGRKWTTIETRCGDKLEVDTHDPEHIKWATIGFMRGHAAGYEKRLREESDLLAGALPDATSEPQGKARQ